MAQPLNEVATQDEQKEGKGEFHGAHWNRIVNTLTSAMYQCARARCACQAFGPASDARANGKKPLPKRGGR